MISAVEQAGFWIFNFSELKDNCTTPPLELDHDDEDGRPQPLPKELCCQRLPDGPLLHQVVDHLKLNFFVDYPAHKDINHAGEAFKNKLEPEDH